MHKLILVVVINVFIVCSTAFAVARGNLPILPWIPVIATGLLALNAAILRKVRVTDRDAKRFLDQPNLLKGGKVFLIFLALACCWAILSSLWSLASGKVETTNLVRVVGAAFVLWFAVSALAKMHKRECS